ncbi:hypothetical protein B0T22DRAFT_485522 [Podospora appendiculata]|uniref:Uncharacterized protein n=1 Tax=Podospora appendiculata TaxID=314037 RepID=A0AAE0WZC3_9PEZI|nr:hypothetical protein B0T22DRAFT_485900 [Podospora appendiculata]KAK3681438.1 hypothetical protein B0T22DRAFT_485522 [Podospora appendiculata]
METPALPMPKDAQEKNILGELTLIRDQLLLMKRDRSNYIRSQDVLPLYERVVEQVRQLNEIRKGAHPGETRLDRVLESCLQLLSLFFMTIGRTTETPAAYALTSTIKRLLDHLGEASLFSAKDLDSMASTINDLDRIIKNQQSHSPYLLELLANRQELCKASLAQLRKRLEDLDEPILDIYERLISILRSMSRANTKATVCAHPSIAGEDHICISSNSADMGGQFSEPEILKLQAQLKEVAASQVDGQFLDENGKVLAGSDKVSELLRRCLAWSDIVLERKGVMPEPFQDKYNTLLAIRNDLEKLSITQAWSLRETDLYDYQRELDKIDESRVDGNFLDDEGRPAELYVQRTLLYLIRRSYGYIYYLMISSEPVSEALLPIYNQLQTLKRCLNEVKNSGGVGTVRELYPYSMKLTSIDNMRVDGKFMFGGDIPEGQGSVSGLLAECFDLCYELRIAADSEEQARGGDEDDDDDDDEQDHDDGKSDDRIDDDQ